MMKDIVAIILAAGYSSRMGDFKPLLKLGDGTAIEHTVHCFRKAGLADVRVVTGHRGDEIAQAVGSLDVRLIYNDNFSSGMYSSVQAGVRTLEPEVNAFFILPADHPLIQAATVQKLLSRFRLTDGRGILYPTFKGQRGHPPLISTRYTAHILHGADPHGLRGVLNRYEDQAVEVQVADQGVLLDMDTPADYQELLNYLRNRKGPSR